MGEKKKIVVITKNPEMFEQCWSQFHDSFEFQFFSQWSDIEGKSVTADLLIYFESGDFEKKMLNTLDKCSKLVPVLVLCERADDQAVVVAKRSNHLRFLFLPQSLNYVAFFASKMIVGENVPQQMYPRFDTNHVTEIEVFGRGTMSVANLKNLSKSGAFLEFEKDYAQFEQGDLLQMTVKLDQVNKVRTMNAEVIWVDQQNSANGKMGVNFISGDDVFTKLMTRL